MFKRFAIFFGFVSMLFAASEGSAVAQDIRIENDAMCLVLSPEGYAQSLIDKKNGEECLDLSGGPVPFCTLLQYRPYDNENFLMYPAKPKTFSSNRISREGDTLLVAFEGTADIAVIDLNIKADYIGFNLKDIDYKIEKIGVKRKTEVDRLDFVRLPIKEREHFGEWLNVMWDGHAGVCLMGAGSTALIDCIQDRCGRIMVAGADAEVSLKDVEAVLVAGSGDVMLDRIAEIEKDYGMPLGVESRKSAEYPYSYYELRDVTVSNIDEHIRYAKQGGFRSMVVYYPDFAYTCGHFLWNDRFPGGMEDLKKITSAIREAGMIPGFHIHYSKVSIDDPYVCAGVADSRLGYVADMLLDVDIDEDEYEIPVDGFIGGLHTEDGRCIVRIGDELVEYSSFTDSPKRLIGCRRGVLGTEACAHSKGELVRLLDVDTWPRFIRIDQNTTLQDEIADNLAKIYDEAGFEFLYFDGAEDVPMPYWYNVSRSQLRVYDRLGNKPLYSEGALKSHYGWHILTRGNAFDLFRPEDIRTAMGRYTLPCAQRIANDFTSVNFGWVDYLAPSAKTIGMQPDMYEYICSKALAYGSPISLMGKLEELHAHPRTPDNLEVVRLWENAKIDGSFDDETKRLLADPNREFVMLADSTGTPCLYEYHKIAIDDDNIRAFAFERDGHSCIIYWAARKDGLCRLPAKISSKCLRVMDTEGREVEFRKSSRYLELPLEGRTIIESGYDMDTLIHLFEQIKEK